MTFRPGDRDERVRLLFADDTMLLIDLTTDIAPQFNSQATQHQLEDGTPASDHIITDPVTLTLTGRQSELVGQSGAYDPDFVGGHIELDNRLTQAWQNKELLYVDTRVRGVYANMAITNYAPTTGQNHGLSLHFTLTLQELTYRETRRRNLRVEQAQSERNAMWEKQKEQGNQPARLASPRTAEAATAAARFPDAPADINVFRGRP